jgi:V/A-type H+-transporting ATPase subunit K
MAILESSALAAALAIGLTGLGAGMAIASTGSAASGAVAEKPEVFGKVLIFVALAEAIAIYGLVVAIMILTK